MKVLLTRLEAQSRQTASKLKALGFEPIILPLTKIEYTNNKPQTPDPDFSVFTSVNGVEALSPGLHSRFRLLPAYAVGPKTAAGLSKKTYNDVRTGGGAAFDLSQLVLNQQTSGKAKGVYFCGEERSFDLAGALEGRINLELCEVYRMVESKVSISQAKQAFDQLSANDFNDGIAIVYSAGGARRLIQLVEQMADSRIRAKLPIVVISGKAAEPLVAHSFKHVQTAAEPTEQAIFKCLKQMRS